MSSYAAVMVWPLNSMTNLMFPWQPRDYKSQCAVWGPLCRVQRQFQRLMTAPLLLSGTHSRWEPFWIETLKGSELWGHLFYTMKSRRGKQKQVFLVPVAGTICGYVEQRVGIASVLVLRCEQAEVFACSQAPVCFFIACLLILGAHTRW